VVDEAMATEIVHNLVGDDTIDVKLKSTSVWSVNHMYAEKTSKGRVFCMGDAIHRHPPSNGLGSNTSIQDAYNLAWKLALVLKGQAAPKLLESYNDERAPIAQQIVDRANKSRTQFGQIFRALGMTPDAPAGRTIDSRKDDTPAAAEQREELRKAIELKDYEFNAHGVELGQRYASGAVVPDGTPEPAYDRDPELYYHPTTWPGARLPHVWLEDGTPLHDRIGDGFTLLRLGRTQADTAPLDHAMRATGAPFAVLAVDDREPRDVYGYDLILLRPDLHIVWRGNRLPDDPAKLAALATGF
jgi:2,4-dichlorophenol 6-monooxygenase